MLFIIVKNETKVTFFSRNIYLLFCVRFLYIVYGQNYLKYFSLSVLSFIYIGLIYVYHIVGDWIIFEEEIRFF